MYFNYILLVPPTHVTLSGQTSVIADGRSVKLNCTAGTSKPVSTILWQRNGTNITNNVPTSTIFDEYNGHVTSQTLTFVPTRDMDYTKYICCAYNVAWGRCVYSNERQLNLTCRLPAVL